jgi:hypothetical protein
MLSPLAARCSIGMLRQDPSKYRLFRQSTYTHLDNKLYISRPTSSLSDDMSWLGSAIAFKSSCGRCQERYCPCRNNLPTQTLRKRP